MDEAENMTSIGDNETNHDEQHGSRVAGVFKGISKGVTNVANTATKRTAQAATNVTQRTLKAASAITKGAVNTTANASSMAASTSVVKNSSADVHDATMPLNEVSLPKQSPSDLTINDHKSPVEAPPMKTVEPISSVKRESQKKNVKVDVVATKASYSLPAVVEIVLDVVCESSLWTSKVTIFFCATLSIAVLPTLSNWNKISLNQIPFTVVACWLLVAFSSGQVCMMIIDRVKIKLNKGSTLMTEHESIENVYNDMHTSQESTEMDLKQSPRSLFKFFGPGNWALPSTAPDSVRKSRPWTNLNKVSIRKRQLWEKDIDPTLEHKNFLMQKLLGYRNLRKTSRSSLILKKNLNVDDVGVTQSAQQEIGNFGVADITASSFDDDVVEPLFHLRGMDIFLSEDPESEAGSHPWLVESGLRDVPTFILNFVTQWGNILLYYEMSDWVTDWNLKEDENDAEDIKALKRFLNGTDDYRNARFKMIPSIVDAPFAVKLVAPAKAEKTVHCDYVKVDWKKYEKEETSSGRKLCIALEATLDLMSTSFIRSAASLVKNNLKLLTVDVAIVISKPDTQEEEEHMACIGCWRFSHVDIKTCPHMPDRYVAEAQAHNVDPSVFRASVVMGVKPTELQQRR